MSYEMNDLLELVVDQNASDLHCQVGQAPTLRISGAMVPIEGPELTPVDTEKLMLSITPDNHQQNVKLNGGTDFGCRPERQSDGTREVQPAVLRKSQTGDDTHFCRQVLDQNCHGVRP